MYYLLGALALFFGEEQIKSRIERHYTLNQKTSLWKNRLILTKHHNYGFIHNKQSKNRKMVLGMSFVSAAALIGSALYTFFSDLGHGMKAGMMFLLAGGLSNAYDRVKRKYVVDYFIINKGRLKRTIFNLADIMLFAGAVCCTIGSLFPGGLKKN